MYTPYYVVIIQKVDLKSAGMVQTDDLRMCL